MTPDVIAILGVGIALAGLILGTVVPGFRELRTRMYRFEGEIREQTTRLETRMSHLETKMQHLEVEMRERMASFEAEMRQQMAHFEAEMRERIARLEGLIEGFVREQRDRKEDAPQL